MSLQAPPYRSPLINALKLAEDVWLKWFVLVQRALNIAGSVLGSVSLSGQGASIAATSIAMATLAGGLYRVSVSHRVTRADNTGSSLTVFVTAVESAITVTYTGAANTSNATGTGKTDTFLVKADASSVIKYGTTYSTTGGAPTMQYRLDVRVEFVPVPA